MNIETSSVLSGLFSNLSSGLDKLAGSSVDSNQLAGLLGVNKTAQAGAVPDSFTLALLQQLQLLESSAVSTQVNAPVLMPSLPLNEQPRLDSAALLQPLSVIDQATFETPSAFAKVESPALLQPLPLVEQAKLESSVAPVRADLLTAPKQSELLFIKQALAAQAQPAILSEALSDTGITQKINALLTQPDTMQEISTLLGKQLPVVKKPAKDIDLNETMQALAEVLGRLSNVVSNPEVLNFAPLTQEQASLNKIAENITQEDDTLQTAIEKALNPLLAEPLSGLLPKQVTARSVESTGADTAQNLGMQTGNADQLKALADSLASLTPLRDIKLQALGADTLAFKQVAGDVRQNLGVNMQGAGNAVENLTNASAALNDTQLNMNNVNAIVENLRLNEQTFVPVEQSSDKAALAVGELQQLGRQMTMATKTDLPPMTKAVNSPQWSQELSSKIIWMNNQNMSSADLKLNPQHLGPISIRIDMQQEQANISFTAHNAGVRELLEASIPKLREMLGAQQINLVDVSVSQQSFAGQGHAQAQNFQQSDNAQKQSGNQGGLAGEANESIDANIQGITEEIEQSHALVSNGLVSVYA